ncbi:MAG: helix-turn-helix domain-containing protein [Alphaproteobacteria bacterium]|nr:helix-turn-helix domain-containing protein [Alphaproteobacteria bacterium]
MPKEFLTPAEVAKIIHQSLRTLEKYRMEGSGPNYYKIGSRIVYNIEDVESWLEQRRRTSTKDSAPPTRGAEDVPPLRTA